MTAGDDSVGAIQQIERVLPGYKYFLTAAAAAAFFSGSVIGQYFDYTEVQFWLASAPLFISIVAAYLWFYKKQAKEAIAHVR